MIRKIKIGLVDDHQIVIDGLLSLLKDEPRFELVFATIHSKDVIDILQTKPVDILLTDVMMPDLPGNLLAKKVRQQNPDVKILALSMNGEGELVNEMISDADISGYILKNTGKKELVEAIEKIADGGICFSDEVLESLEKISIRQRQYEQAHLTDRETEIIRLIEKEYSNKQIAETLFISERTVETHRKNIFRKTNTTNVIGLIKYAYEHKLI